MFQNLFAGFAALAATIAASLGFTSQSNTSYEYKDNSPEEVDIESDEVADQDLQYEEEAKEVVPQDSKVELINKVETHYQEVRSRAEIISSSSATQNSQGISQNTGNVPGEQNGATHGEESEASEQEDNVADQKQEKAEVKENDDIANDVLKDVDVNVESFVNVGNNKIKLP